MEDTDDFSRGLSEFLWKINFNQIIKLGLRHSESVLIPKVMYIASLQLTVPFIILSEWQLILKYKGEYKICSYKRAGIVQKRALWRYQNEYNLPKTDLDCLLYCSVRKFDFYLDIKLP